MGGLGTLVIPNTKPLRAEPDEPCEISYADRKGKYQNQQGIVLPKL
jgi:hypothetical protein